MVRLLVLLALTMFTAGGGQALAADPPPSVAGMYTCQGMNPDGTAYNGIVQIAAVADTFLVRWDLPDHVEVWCVGIFKDGLLAVSYFGGTPALAMYKLQGEQLVGQWTMGGTEGMVYSETLTRMPEGTLPAVPTPAPKPPRTKPSPRQREV